MDDRLLDAWLMRDAALDAAAQALVGELYAALAGDEPATYVEVADIPAGQFTVVGWRWAARLAELDGNERLAADYRRRALERNGQDPGLDPGSAGYLMTIYPRRVEVTAEAALVICTIPTTRRGEPCTFKAARTAEAAHQAHEAYLAHVIHDHSTTAGAAGANQGEPF